MRNFFAIFNKQVKDTLKNPAVLMSFLIFPLVAFMMTFATPNLEGVPEDVAQIIAATMPNLATMMAVMFAGMGLIPIVAGVIAEDIEKKSLRFLSMAGIKPTSYLLGVNAVSVFFSFFTALAFGLISDFRGLDFWVFVGSLLSGVMASIFLGATLGILCKSQQAASGLTMPAAVVLGFGPMLAQFNPTVARVLHPLYTQQLNVIADHLGGVATGTPLWQPFAIIWANVAVLGLLFALVYRNKGIVSRV